MEDLWAFNEEAVARAIFNCRTPVISAVGHETDVTIADYVADLRAPTPSAAAELAVFDLREFWNRLNGYAGRLNGSMQSRISLARQRLEGRKRVLGYLSPENQIRERRMRLISQEEKLTRLMEQAVREKRYRLGMYIERMKGLSPLAKLNQGFSYVEGADGRAVTSTAQVVERELLKIHVSDGQILARVEKTQADTPRKA